MGRKLSRKKHFKRGKKSPGRKSVLGPFAIGKSDPLSHGKQKGKRALKRKVWERDSRLPAGKFTFLGTRTGRLNELGKRTSPAV